MNAKDILAAARLSLHRKMPYLTSIAFTMRLREMPGIGTLAVDAGWRLYYDPVTVEDWGAKVTTAVLVHEVMHCLRRHADRNIGADPKKRNICEDCEINDDIEQMGFDLPDPWLPEHLKCDDGMTAEYYYANYPDDAPQSGSGEGQPGPGSVGGQCGGCAGNPHDWEEDAAAGAPPKVEASEQAVVRQQVAQAIVQHAKTRGNVPGGLKDWAEREIAPPTIDWRKQFASAVRSTLAEVAGRVDYTRKRLSRRFGAMRSRLGQRAPLMPSMFAPVPQVACVLDVSGSMFDGSLEKAMSEVLGIVKAVGAEVTVYATDMEVAGVGAIRTARDFKKIDNAGGGGTDMRVGVAAAMKDRPHVIVVLTDGYTLYPTREDMQGIKIIAAITPGGQSAPDHIRSIRITNDDD